MSGMHHAGAKPVSVRSPLRSIIGGSIGNLVEWYDWYVYAAFSLYFASRFFPSSDPTIELMNAAAVFAAGFLMRPVGGWLMGIYADRHGRKTALTVSVMLMSFGSFLIAILPTYDQIGLAAPIILLLVRMLQGLSVGGEYGASATYLSEMAPPHRRGFYSSFQYVTLVGGQLLALGLLLLLQQLMDPATLEDWGWRIPFAMGGLLAIVALAMRRGLEETSAFSQAGHRPGGIGRLLREHPRAVLTVIGMTIGGTVAFYSFTTYTQKFLVNSAGWSKSDATLVCAIALLLFLPLQPLFGLLSDRIGRRPLLIAFGVLGSLAVFPILSLLRETQNPWIAGGLIMTALVIVSGYTSINAIVKAELFPPSVRALGVGLPYAVTVSLFGGTAEFIALWARAANVEALYFGYVTACIILSLVTYLVMPTTNLLHDGDAPVPR